MELRIPYKILLLAWLFALPTRAQVPSENYVQTTERISDTESLTTTQYYDGLGRPYEKVEHGITPVGDNLVWLQQYELNCKYYRVSMQGLLQDKGYYPGRRVYVTKTTDEDGEKGYRFSYNRQSMLTDADYGEGESLADNTMVQDQNKGISSIIYDINNLPRQIKFTDLLSDVASSKMGNGLNKSGGVAIAVGATAVAAGASSLVITGGTSSIVSVPAVAIGKELTVAGAAASATGNVMMMNAKSNKAQGYDRGKKTSSGIQTNSKTLWQSSGKDKGRIDIENPNPKERKGQMHYQDGNKKYLYDDKKKQFIGAPNRINKLLQTNKKVQNAIKKGTKYLGQ